MDRLQKSESVELYVFLSDFCNFSCSHCIAHSDPKASKYKLTRDELHKLAEHIDSDKSIGQVHFIGGEPTLQLKNIRAIQELVKREIRYSITTNGWFASNPDRILSQIQLNEIHISFDAYHSKFSNRQFLKELLATCVQRGLRTYLKATIRSQKELLSFGELLSPGVDLIVNKLESAGKARALNLTSQEGSLTVWDETCPSIRTQLSNAEAIVYFPGKGLTPCCSSLIFDELADNNFLFSSLEQPYHHTNEIRKLFQKSFRESAQEVGINIATHRPPSPCKACEFLHAKLDYLNLPSKYDIARSALTGPCTYHVSQELKNEDVAALADNFRLTYLSVGIIHHPANGTQNTELPGDVERKLTSKNDLNQLSRFAYEVMSQSSAQLTKAELSNTNKQLEDFLQYCSHAILYRISGNPIAGLYVHRNLFHPILNETVAHIGFLGIDKSINDPSMRRALKSDMIEQLKQISQGTKVSGRIAANNYPALKFAESMGRRISSLTISKKPT